MIILGEKATGRDHLPKVHGIWYAMRGHEKVVARAGCVPNCTAYEGKNDEPQIMGGTSWSRHA